MINVISLGLGVQSTALYYQSSMGILPRADYAIVADPGKERKKTYQYLEEVLMPWVKANNGIPILMASDRNLYNDLIYGRNSLGKNFASIPAFTMGDDGKVGMLKRQCTGEYKIQQVDDKIRDAIYGLKPKQRRPQTRVWHGITLEEAERMSIPERQSWKINVYPYVGYEVDCKGNVQKCSFAVPSDRADLLRWYESVGIPAPDKSGCAFCPYMSDWQWADMKENEPEEFEDVCVLDESIRASSQMGIVQPIYLHRSCVPLREAQFDKSMRIQWGECSGNCHV